MAARVVHAHVTALPNDGSKDISATVWNEDHTITGLATVAETGAYSDLTGTPTTIVGLTGTAAQFNTACTDDNFAYIGAANSFTAGQTITPADNTSALTVASHTQTASNPALNIAQTWNAAGVTFTGKLTNITDTASAAASLIEDWQIDGVRKMSVGKNGVQLGLVTPGSMVAQLVFNVSSGQGSTLYSPSTGGGLLVADNSNVSSLFLRPSSIRFGSNGVMGWTSASNTPAGTLDAVIARAAANSILFAGASASAGGATTRTEINKAIASIADATATTVFTVTIPNAEHSAVIEVNLAGKIGAGGAIGAGEATGNISYQIAVARTAGVNAVATISAAYGSATAAVAGATTITVAGTLGAITGAVGASNTFDIKVTVTKGGGASANHTCLAYARLMNSNATGVTIS